MLLSAAMLAMLGCSAPEQDLVERIADYKRPEPVIIAKGIQISLEKAYDAFKNAEALRQKGNFLEADAKYRIAEDNVLFFRLAREQRRDMMTTRIAYMQAVVSLVANLKNNPRFTEERIQELEKIVADKPQNHNAWCDLGYVYLGRGNISSMTRAFEQAYSIEKHDERVQLGRAQSTILSGRIRLAEYYAAEAVGLFPKNSEIREILAGAHVHRGRLDSAIKVLDKGLELNPDDPNLMHSRYNLYLDIQSWYGAYRDCRRLIEINPARTREYRNNLPQLEQLAKKALKGFF